MSKQLRYLEPIILLAKTTRSSNKELSCLDRNSRRYLPVNETQINICSKDKAGSACELFARNFVALDSTQSAFVCSGEISLIFDGFRRAVKQGDHE